MKITDFEENEHYIYDEIEEKILVQFVIDSQTGRPWLQPVDRKNGGSFWLRDIDKVQCRKATIEDKIKYGVEINILNTNK